MSDDLALVPIAEALPELRASQYAQVREWDAARMALAEGFEAADGEYLRLIRDALKPTRGLWTAYLRERGIPVATAGERIRKAEGRFVATPRTKLLVTSSFVEPARVTITEEARDLDWPPPPPDDDTPVIIADDDWPPPARIEAPPTRQERARQSFSIAEWKALPADERAFILAAGQDGTSGLNKQDTDNIEWARWSWNPVTGCLHNCPYCYARDIANRFYPQGFTPTFMPSRLGAPMHQKVPDQAEHELGYRNIFTCSMADLFGKWVPAEWIEAVLDVVRRAPQWNFLFLTKFPNRLAEFEYPDNAWLGTSVDCQARVANAERSFARVRSGVKWLSIEPLLEPLRFDSLDMFDWVVIGGASASSQTPEWHPPRRWVDDLEAAARAAGCMVYEKSNLQARLREYPGWERQEATLPAALRYLPNIGEVGR